MFFASLAPMPVTTVFGLPLVFFVALVVLGIALGGVLVTLVVDYLEARRREALAIARTKQAQQEYREGDRFTPVL